MNSGWYLGRSCFDPVGMDMLYTVIDVNLIRRADRTGERLTSNHGDVN